MGTKKRALWEPTKYQGIFRYRSRGTLYARFKVAGKQVRQSRKTTDLELARTRLAEGQLFERTKARRLQKGQLRFGEVLAIYMRSVELNPKMKVSTKRYYRQRTAALLRSWPELEKMDIRKISDEDLEAWAWEMCPGIRAKLI